MHICIYAYIYIYIYIYMYVCKPQNGQGTYLGVYLPCTGYLVPCPKVDTRSRTLIVGG